MEILDYPTEAGLTSKWGKISPTVQWYYQNYFSCIIQRTRIQAEKVKKKISVSKSDYSAKFNVFQK